MNHPQNIGEMTDRQSLQAPTTSRIVVFEEEVVIDYPEDQLA